jgi:hypothetical protein
MYLLLQIGTVFLVAVAMTPALAHALELPGKMRLDRQAYLTVQPIYYPGFTVVGGAAEVLSPILTLVLLVTTPTSSSPFVWILAGLVFLLAMHAVYWTVTHPVNRVWLKDQKIGRAGSVFFSAGASGSNAGETGAAVDWLRLRKRWEYSHAVRAVCAGLALLALIVAIAL